VAKRKLTDHELDVLAANHVQYEVSMVLAHAFTETERRIAEARVLLKG
jgi:hypothetical protein